MVGGRCFDDFSYIIRNSSVLGKFELSCSRASTRDRSGTGFILNHKWWLMSVFRVCGYSAGSICFPSWEGIRGVLSFCLSKKIHTAPAPSQEGKELPTFDLNKLINHHLWFRMRQAILRSHVEARERDGSLFLRSETSLRLSRPVGCENNIFIFKLYCHTIISPLIYHEYQGIHRMTVGMIVGFSTIILS